MNKILNKRNGIIAAIVAVVVIGAIVASTTFSQAMTLDEAKEAAKKYVPATAGFITSEEEDNKYEVIFYDEGNKESFEVEVNTETKKVRKVESQLDNDLGSKKVELKEEQVKEIVKKRFGNVTSVSVTLNKDNGLYEFEAAFKANDFYGSADINAVTGAVLESTVKYGTAVTIPAGNGDEGDLLSYAEVEKAAIKEAGGGVVKDVDLEKTNDGYVYEVELVKDSIEYNYFVDAKTGKVTLEYKHEAHMDYDDDDDDDYYDVEYPSQGTGGNSGNTGNSGNSGTTTGRISEAKAKNIVLAKIPGASIVNIRLEMEDGIYVYEGEARLGDYEYDFEINASSGVIISWESDRIDHDDQDDNWDDDDHDDQWDD